jgi:hypothetical protein
MQFFAVAMALVPQMATAAVFKATSAGHLRAAPAMELDTGKLQAALGGLVNFTEVTKSEGDEAQPQGIQLRIDEPELKTLTANMSAGCQQQWLGKDSQLHSFSEAGNEDAAACQRLKGTICQIETLIEAGQTLNGKTVHEQTHATGKGCLPQECMAAADLEGLTNLMRFKVQEVIGKGHLSMHVDCSSSGGSTVALGKAAQASEGGPKLGNVGKRSKSGAAKNFGAVAALLASTVAVASVL